ncbi:Endonuclease, Uma2 family (restriction endonuclease fold) [Granulicella rosea]|uniref:Endonuclease, Uma2 family (Restriction endonuclease fold) n=1 Tax=Granulicella rosea TaxID=474952 RepID=A0A239DG14_9BACT|nr:Uma2 family endonuclease [Granulicella rosea]SNS30713.1 Endonuclease, Uma2 family (restriction endonuclease fold) [Granulicella rosea]
MAAAHTLPFNEPYISPQEYLRTSYRPDRDYVNGRVEDRNVGEWEHATVQKMLMRIFLTNEEAWGVNAIQECRLQIAEDRFRVPDTMVLRAGLEIERIVYDVPLICIEVISREDTWKRLQEVLGDYLAFGVPHIWAFDPETRKAYRYDERGLTVVNGALSVPGTSLVLHVDEVFPR